MFCLACAQTSQGFQRDCLRLVASGQEAKLPGGELYVELILSQEPSVVT